MEETSPRGVIDPVVAKTNQRLYAFINHVRHMRILSTKENLVTLYSNKRRMCQWDTDSPVFRRFFFSIINGHN